MFKLNFLPNFRTQRKAFLAAKSYAPFSMHPSLRASLEEHLKLESSPNLSSAPKGILIDVLNAIKPLLLRSILANIVIALCSLLVVLLTREIIKVSSGLNYMLAACAVVFFVEVVRNAIQYIDLMWRAQAGRCIQSHLFALINRKLVAIDTDCSHEFSSGNLKTMVASDVASIESFISAACHNWVPAIVLLFVMTPLIYHTTGILGLAGIAVAVLQIPISIIFARYIEKFQSKMLSAQDDLTTLVGEWVRNIRLVRYLGWQSIFARDIEESVRKFTVQGMWHHFLVVLTFAMSFTWWMIPVLVIFLLAQSWAYPIGLINIFSSIWALSYLMTHIQYAPYAISLYGSAIAGIKRIEKFLAQPEQRAKIKKIAPLDLRQDIPVRVRFEKVGLKISEKHIFQDLDLSFNLKSKIAVVGKVGSGKSLLLELLVGERSLTSGDILVEFASGISVPLWSEPAYDLFRSIVAYTPQIPFLSNTSLRANISLDESGALDDVLSAVKKSQLEEDVQSFSNGLEEEVGEVGINLSGGQKQRVSLARAFYSKRPYFVLDDPLSAVDRRTEEKLFSSIMESCQGFLLVSHRLDELKACDRIVVLEEGIIVEDSTPQNLISNPNSHLNRYIAAARENR